LTGIKTGTGSSGSTGWDGGFRSRLYLHWPKEEDGEDANADARVLTRVKANWAKIGEDIPMHWGDGVFVADRAAGGIIGSIERRKCKRVFLDLLTNSRPVSPHSRASNFGPKLFALRPDREGYRQTDFIRAMEELLASKEITIVTYRHNGHDHEKLAAAKDSSRKTNGQI
jgi:hypothetical protein